MQRLIWAALLIGSAVRAAPDCTHTSREQYVSGWEEVAAAERLQQRITAAGIVNCVYFPDQGQHLNVLARFEQGVLQGAGYKVYYSDGSGVVQGARDQPLAGAGYADTWRLSCDRTGPPFQCSLARGALVLQQAADGTRTLRIGSDPRAGTQLLLRVDTQWAVTAPAETGFTTEQTRTLLNQLRAGKSAAVGYHEASVRGVSNRTIPLFGFAQGLEILDTVLIQLNSASGARE